MFRINMVQKVNSYLLIPSFDHILRIYHFTSRTLSRSDFQNACFKNKDLSNDFKAIQKK